MTDKTASENQLANQAESERIHFGDLEALGESLKDFGRGRGEALSLAQDAAGRLVIITPDGQRTAYPGTEALVQALAGRLPAFADELRMAQVDIDRLMRGLESQLVDKDEWQGIVFRLDRQLADIIPLDGSLTWRRSAPDSSHLESRYDTGKIGRGIGHLPPLPGEDFLFRNDARQMTEVANIDADALDPRGDAAKTGLELAGIGNGIGHLPPMPDGARRITGEPDRNLFSDFARLRGFETSTAAQQPRAENDAYRMSEDGRLTGRLFDNDFLPNGVRDLKITVPPLNGTVVLGDDGVFIFTPSLHFSGDVVFTYAFTDLRTGLTVTADARITVAAVADAPEVKVPAATIFTDEDTPVIITGLGGALVDKDGSETLNFRLENVPEGANFGGRGVYLGGGVWQFTPAELATPLTFTPPLHWHGSVDLALVGVARETANGDVATTRRVFNVTVNAEVDAPTLTNGTTRFNEDVPQAFGRNITYALVDKDGSENISRVELSGIPADVTITYTVSAGAVVTRIGQLWRIEGDQAAIRATLDTFAAARPLHGDADFQIGVAVTSRDADGSTAITTGTHGLIIDAVADAPGIYNSASGFEDTTFAVPVTVVLVDQDGSERLAYVDVAGVPTGATLGWNTLLPGTVTNQGGGTFRFTGTTAQIQALLGGLTILPPANSDVDFALTVTAVSEEFNPSEVGGVAVLRATTVASIPVTVTAVADTPTLAATTTTGNEDSAIAFGANITFAVADTDGSEVISKLRIAGVPTGGVIGWNTLLPGTVTNLGGGVYEITGSEAQIRALTATLTLTPPVNSDADFTLTHTVTALDNNSSVATRVVTQGIVVTAVADAPTASVGTGTFNIDQDVATALPGLGGALTDTDGTETLVFRLSGIPTGSTFNLGTNLGGGVWQFTPAHLATGLIFTPPLFYSGTINATLSSISTETSNSSSATTSLPFTLVVGPIADAPVVNATSSTGNEDASILVGANITYALTDTDGSEVIERVQVTGIPAGASATWTVSGTATFTAVAGGYKFEGPQADIRATLDSLRIQPPANADVNISLTVAVTSKELANGNTTTTTATHSLIVNAVADAPVISGGATGNEDSAILLPITVALGDTDGSETLAFVEVSGVPTGAVLGWNGVLPGTVSNPSTSVFRFTGTTAQIQALLASVTITPPANSDVDFNLTVLARATESAPAEAGGVALINRDTTFIVPVTVTAVADLPTLSAGSTTGNEDASILFGPDITYALTDTDGTETITRITLAGFPAGSAVAYTANGAAIVAFDGTTYTLTGTPAEIRATLNTFAVTQTANSDVDFSLTTTVTATDTAGVTATRNGTHGIVVNAVSDTPVLSAGTVSGEEDTFINFGSQVTWVKPDNDGTERVARVEITGFGSATAQYVASGGATVTMITGGFAITGPNEAGIRATLDTFAVKQALNSDADLTLTTQAQTIDGVATASAYGSVAQSIVVDAQADAPTVNVAAISGNEDTSIIFGDKITFTKPDNDGSEWISRVTLSGFPAGWAVTYTANGAVTVTGDAQSGYVLSIAAKANEGLLRNLLNTFAVTGPANSDADATIQATATTTDADGSTAVSAPTNVPVVVNAVADSPVLSAGTVSGEEDTFINFGSQVTWVKPDNDGTERVARVEITGFGSATAQYVASGGATVTMITGGFAITGPNEAGIRATLDTFAVKQALNSDADLTLTTQAQTIDGVATASAYGSVAQSIVVDAQADAPTVNVAAISGNEDTSIIFGDKITFTKPDNDGSEWISRVTLSGFPAGWAVTYTANGAVTVTGDAQSGYVLSIAAKANEGLLRNLLNTFAVTGPANSDADATIQATATTTDADGSTAVSAPTNVPVVVNAVADSPVLSAATVSGEEDTFINFGSQVTWVKPDNDGTERVARVEITGFGSATAQYVASGGATVTMITGGFAITGPNEAGIRATLDTFAVKQALNSDADLTLTTQAQTIDGVATASAYGSVAQSIVVDAQADAPTVNVAAISGNEDTSIIFGDKITFTKPDNDGSEWISRVTLSGFPAGWAVTYTANGAVTVTGDAQSGYVLSIAAKANEGLLRNLLNTFAVTGPANSDADATIQATATTTDADGSTAVSAPTNVPVVVNAVADSPSSSAANATGAEDTAIPLTLATGVSGDIDGSETLTMRITGVPTGATFDRGTNSGGGVWTFSAADIAAGVNFTPPAQYSGTINMVLVSRSTETSNSNLAESSSPFTVTVTPVLDPIDVTNTVQTVNEDTVISAGSLFGINLADADGSQSLTYRVSGIPAGYTVGRVLTGLTTFTDLGGGVIEFSGPNAANVITSVRTMTLTAAGVAIHKDANFTLTIDATTVEAGGATSNDSATHAVTVSAVADQPTIAATNPTVNEDPAGPIPFAVTVSLVDTDGSETLNQVDVTFTTFTGTVPTLNWNTGLPGTVTGISNGQRFTGTTAQVQALLASLTVTPQTHNGTNIGITVVARAQETNPTDGEVATLTATRTSNYTINMVPVADQPTVTAPGIGTPFNTEEDTVVTLTGLGGALVDNDLSEVLTYRILGVPTGATFGGVGTNLGGGIWQFTKAQVDAGLNFTPPNGYSGTVDMTLRAIATETENSVTATNDAVLRVVVDAQADAPTVTGSSIINEDVTTIIGTNIAIALTDADGSEYISQVVISGFPAGAAVAFGTSDPAVTVTGSGTGPFTLSISSAGDAAKLRSVLDSLSVTAPANDDANFNLTVQATSKDVDGSTAPTSATHAVTVRAVADAPTVVANDVVGTEDVIVFPLALSANLNDVDGSETLSARILDVPTGAVLTANIAGGGTFINNGNGTYSITAPTPAQLNTILGSIAYTPVPNSSNSVTMRLEVTATEAANGGEVAAKTSVVIDPFTIMLTAVVDTPTLKVVAATGGNSGYEDTAIPLNITADLVDKDGSEVLSLSIADVPAGARFVNSLGANVGTNTGGGVWTFTSGQIADLRIIAPLNSNADFTLSVTLTSTEVVPGNPGNGTSASVTLPLAVNVIGVADTPNLTVNVINSPEDTTIPLGANIIGSLADTDGSEVLYYVLSGLPAGVLPSVGTFIGGEWQITAAEMPLLTIPAPVQFSGNYTATYAPSLSVRAVAQEDDGNQTSTTRALQVNVTPVMDAFPGWSPSVQVTEDNNIPLANAASGINLVDNDGSEKVDAYTFDLNGLIAAAGIGGTVPSLAHFIANSITGTFTDNGDGTITVLAANLSGVAFRAAAFKDSNIDFTVPVSALVSETGGLTQTVNGTYSVDIVGDADVPTVYAQNVSGVTGQLIRLNPNSPTGHNFGGDITDTDVADGRANSERVYYIVSGMNSVPGLEVAFFNSAGALVGLNNNDGTWYLTKADLADLHIVSRYGQTGNLTLTLTSITEENDLDRAVATTPATFTATFTPDVGGGSGNINPLTPVIDITPMTGLEDGRVNFTVTVTPAPGDPSPVTPTVVLLISDLPAGASIIGATFNPSTGRYIATAADLASGLVRIVPPANFSGPLNITVEAVATNTQLNNASTGPQVVTVNVTPVADGMNISASPVAGTEDMLANLNLNVSLRDADTASPETLDGFIRVSLTNGATLSAGTLVSPGVYDLTPAQLAGLQVIPAANLHGVVNVTVVATSRETANGVTNTTTSNFSVNFAAAGDAPNATAANVSGNEDGTIALTGLSAALVDTDGSERLSVKIIGIPAGSILSAGANNGDGSWTISPSDLATLSIKPPKDYSGVMALSLQAFSLDANGNTATTTVPFNVTVTPAADAANLNAVNVNGNEDVAVALSLGLAMGDTTGVLAGENPAERVELTFDGVLAGAVLQSVGGTLVQLAPDQWRFTGTTAEAATLAYLGAANISGEDSITVTAVALDGASRGVADVDTFKVTLAGVADAPTITDFSLGTAGANSIAINVAATFPDNDGSETHVYAISGVTGGGTFNAGTDMGSGVWQFTAAQLTGLAYVPGAGGGTVNLTLETRATETVGGSTVATTANLTFITGDSGANSIVGTADADRINGLDGNDNLTGGPGIDILTGGGGADRFIWSPAHTGGGADQITDFNTGQGDRLDIAALLIGFNPGVTPITNFVQLTEMSGNTLVEIDPNGGGSFTVSLAILQGATGLNAETMRLAGNIIA